MNFVFPCLDIIVKAKTCKVCPKTFNPWTSLEVVCSLPCAIKHAQRKETRRMKKEFLAKDRPHQIKLAQKAFNAFIRKRDESKGCISCGTTKPNRRYDAGHYFSIGAYPELRFNEDNCHKQCHWDCNIQRSGNIAAYRLELIRRIGHQRVEALETNQERLKLTIEDLKEITRKYKAKLKEL